MKVYEIKRDGITILLASDDLPKETDIIMREWDIELPLPEIIEEIENNDYVLHYENGEWTLKKLE